jgi:hypothetical protein
MSYRFVRVPSARVRDAKVPHVRTRPVTAFDRQGFDLETRRDQTLSALRLAAQAQQPLVLRGHGCA